MPQIVFALQARIKLEQRLARALARQPKALETAMTDLRDRLGQAFPGASVVLVQDLYLGFRVRPDEHVLLVEVADGGRDDGPAVVKLGPPDRLQHELDAWESCRPLGLRHDLVLMSVQPCRHDGRLVALRYDDAEQLIGVDQTLTLEAALLDAVRLGVPTPQSVADVLFQLYERLGLLLYRHSDDENPADPGYPFEPRRLDPKLFENLERWNDETRQAFLTRSSVNVALEDAGLGASFRDPAFLVEWIIRRPDPASHLPRLLRGRAHGDLHGRNVLVGKIGDRVLWPAVYDYGAMGRDNLIGWDFVKMETEFKLRAYPLLLAEESFVPALMRQEIELFQATERFRAAGRFPALADDAGPLERFRWLVLTIRRLAGTHLNRGNRSMLWLHEYYFLLAVYGLNSGRFDNLAPIEQKAAYLAAGAAADRFADTFRQQPKTRGKP